MSNPSNLCDNNSEPATKLYSTLTSTVQPSKLVDLETKMESIIQRQKQSMNATVQSSKMANLKLKMDSMINEQKKARNEYVMLQNMHNEF